MYCHLWLHTLHTKLTAVLFILNILNDMLISGERLILLDFLPIYLWLLLYLQVIHIFQPMLVFKVCMKWNFKGYDFFYFILVTNLAKELSCSTSFIL